MSTWVDFKELRAKLNFERVLQHYKVEVKRKGNQHHGFCPLPNHNGKRNSPSFSANLERGIFQCFGCGAKGNLLEFAALMENVAPEDGNALRGIALELQKKFCPGGAGSTAPKIKAPEERAEPLPKGKLVVINAELDFELKGLDSKHPYLLNRGFRPQTIEHFGLGFCSRGLLKDRIAIPLNCQESKLIGYAGRVVDDAAVSEDNPRYRLPGKRERDGHVFDFRKTLFLYNGFRVKAPVDHLYLVEGFSSVWWLHQNGFQNTVATMGAACSEKQAELVVSLVQPSGRIWIIPDGDEAGERLAESLLVQLSPHRFIRWVKLEEEKQPTDLSGAQLKDCFRD